MIKFFLQFLPDVKCDMWHDLIQTKCILNFDKIDEENKTKTKMFKMVNRVFCETCSNVMIANIKSCTLEKKKKTVKPGVKFQNSLTKRQASIDQKCIFRFENKMRIIGNSAVSMTFPTTRFLFPSSMWKRVTNTRRTKTKAIYIVQLYEQFQLKRKIKNKMIENKWK